MARLNPADRNVAEIGDELAVARALSDAGQTIDGRHGARHRSRHRSAGDISALTQPHNRWTEHSNDSCARVDPGARRGASFVTDVKRAVSWPICSAHTGARENVIVLGLPRGGIPVAWEVAAALGAPLDAFVVRKLGAPGHEEFAVGALASGGRVVVNDDVLRALRVTPQQLRDVAEREGRELIRREAAYRAAARPSIWPARR